MVKRKILEIANFFTENSKFGFDQESADKFNFAVIKRIEDNITYEEFWILANCYYDYTAKKFKTINVDKPCFGIQIQANGTYPGEAAYDSNNIGINVWRHAISSTDTSWDSYGVTSGWYNAFMIDSYGGMTIGGAGFEVDGNGIHPFTRLTSSRTTIDGVNCSLFGLLDNAYHAGTNCDDNNTYSWFAGIIAPIDNNHAKDNQNARFVIMYNDTPYTGEANKHNVDITKWKTVFSVDTTGMDWDNIANKPTIDNTAANNSDHLITSQAVYNGLNNKVDKESGKELVSSNIEVGAEGVENSYGAAVIEYVKWGKVVICHVEFVAKNNVPAGTVIPLITVGESNQSAVTFKPNSLYLNTITLTASAFHQGFLYFQNNTEDLKIKTTAELSARQTIDAQMMWFAK